MREPPAFVTSHPAPDAWQQRIQGLDRNLWIAWNAVHPEGPRWCVVRWHGRPSTLRGIPLLDNALRDWDSELMTALGHGWAFVGDLVDREGRPCGLTDDIVAAMHKNDWFRTYGPTKEEAEAALAKEAAALPVARQEAHDDLMREAFEETQKDAVLSRGATSVVSSGAGA